jgi:head-tail adaptor
MTRRKRGSLVTFERATVTTDDYGGETQSWATLCQEYAQVFYGKGDERRQAAMEQGGQAATFQVPSNTNTRSVTLGDRISFDSSAWDIESKAVDIPDRRHVEFTATRAQ